MTYIPRQPKLNKERIEAKLEAGLARKLESYCEYLESDRDYVIGQALEIAFKKDKAFAEWISGHPIAISDKTITQSKKSKLTDKNEGIGGSA